MSFVNAGSQQSGLTLSTGPLVSSSPQWKPHTYQLGGIKMLLSQGSVGLFLDPGLGKTSMCLAAFKILLAKKFASKMLIIAPLRPCYKVWPDEIKKWADFNHLKFQVLHGKNKEKNLATDADIYIINPEGLPWLFSPQQKIRIPQFDVLVIDESSKFKNSQTQRFKLLKPLLPSFARRWILTGTPIPNGLADLFGQIYILDLGASIGRYITHFRREFFDQSGYGGYDYTPKYGAFDRVVEKIKPLILQLSAEDHLKMPELIYQDIRVDIPAAAMALYKKVEDGFFAEIREQKIVAANKAVAGGKCRQIANGAVYVNSGEACPDSYSTITARGGFADINTASPKNLWSEIHDAKLDALEDLNEELGGKPLLVLYEFQHDMERLLKRFPQARAFTGLSQKKAGELQDAFNRGEIPMLLGHPDSMGFGLNLQETCHHVVWFGIPWNLSFYDQAIARVYRQGQKAGTVFIYHLVAAGTLDEKVLKVLTAKDRTQQNLLTALGGE